MLPMRQFIPVSFIVLCAVPFLCNSTFLQGIYSILSLVLKRDENRAHLSYVWQNAFEDSQTGGLKFHYTWLRLQYPRLIGFANPFQSLKGLYRIAPVFKSPASLKCFLKYIANRPPASVGGSITLEGVEYKGMTYKRNGGSVTLRIQFNRDGKL